MASRYLKTKGPSHPIQWQKSHPHPLRTIGLLWSCQAGCRSGEALAMQILNQLTSALLAAILSGNIAVSTGWCWLREDADILQAIGMSPQQPALLTPIPHCKNDCHQANKAIRESNRQMAERGRWGRGSTSQKMWEKGHNCRQLKLFPTFDFHEKLGLKKAFLFGEMTNGFSLHDL